MQWLHDLSDWFTGGSLHYNTLFHCMQGDVLWVAITVALDVAVATGYMLIAMHWWKNQKRVPPTPARTALGNIRNIFVFCGICGYAFIPVKMFWPAWRLYDMFMLVLVYFTWRYAVQAKDLKVVYNELGRSNELNQELEKSRSESRRKTFFLNSLSHDLRTPLNAIVLHSHVVKLSLNANQGIDRGKVEESLAEMETNVRAATELLDRLLQCAKLDWSEEPNDLSSFELDGFLNPMLRSMQAEANEKGISLRLQCPPLARIQTDRLKLERILSNLLANAIKFTDAGDVKVVAECASDALEIHVIDSGIGMSEDQQGRLFEEFYQVQNHARDRKKGFGLGLSIARRLARQLGGDIEVESALGRGSRFSVLLPGAYAQSGGSSEAIVAPGSIAPSISNNG